MKKKCFSLFQKRLFGCNLYLVLKFKYYKYDKFRNVTSDTVLIEIPNTGCRIIFKVFHLSLKCGKCNGMHC